jgi:hypothetical protein
MNAQEGLIEARRRIEAGWTRGLWACDDKGIAVSIGSPQACAYCAEGALLSLISAGLEWATAISFLNEALPVKWFGEDYAEDGVGIAEFNDHEWTTKEDVLALYDRAIAHAGQNS